jgi:hypothetical protein
MAGFKYLFITILFVIITPCSAFDQDQTQDANIPTQPTVPTGDSMPDVFSKNIWRHPTHGLTWQWQLLTAKSKKTR